MARDAKSPASTQAGDGITVTMTVELMSGVHSPGDAFAAIHAHASGRDYDGPLMEGSYQFTHDGLTFTVGVTPS